MISGILLLALASVTSAGEIAVWSGNNCPGGCDSHSKLIVAADRGTECIPFLGKSASLSVESLTNIAPACAVQFYADAKCTVPEFVVDTTKRTPCKNFPGPGAMQWSCAGGHIHDKRNDNITGGTNDNESYSNGSINLPTPNPPSRIARDGLLAKRQCNHDGLYNGMLFYGPQIRTPEGATEGGQDVIVREMTLGGAGGVPAGTINADARDVAREAFRRGIPSRDDELEFEITTAAGLRFEVTMRATNGGIIQGAVTQIGGPALAAIIAAALVAMSETRHQLIFFHVHTRELSGAVEPLIHFSIDLLDDGSD
ncbi:hypothetical protein GE09DRAFT_1128643 [Coniochaeta sp. 2T2.1]|nr:hypothetical protein GE09DRAFT_1128643 [Coniochaeta sp. 2T2.1]